MRQFLLFLMMIFLALATANTWASEHHYTFEDDKAWEVATETAIECLRT